MPLSSALGPLSNQSPQYQNQYTLVNENGWLRFAAVSRRALALPNEILGEIFVHCLPKPGRDRGGQKLPEKMKPNDAPLVLCAVCRRWRDIALTTPGLWGFHSLKEASALSDSGADYVECSKTLLSRAGITPVFIEFDAYVEDERVVSLLELIGKSNQQWRGVWLFLGDNLPQKLRLPKAGKFPVLEKLALSTSFSKLSISFCDAPKLWDVYLEQSSSRIRLPWHQLTSYKTTTILIPYFLQVLTDAPNLVDAKFGIASTLSPSLPSIVVCPMHLKSLKLTYGGQNRTKCLPITILNCLKAPALEHLALSFRDPQGPFLDISPFLSFVSRSSFRLRTLSLSYMPATTDSLIECLKAIPTIVSLELRPRLGVDINALLVQCTGKSDKFLPKLRRFLLAFSKSGVSGLTPTTASLVIDMLCWRWSMVGSTRLRSFTLSRGSHRTHAESVLAEAIRSHPEYRRLKEEGLLLFLGPVDHRGLFGR